LRYKSVVRRQYDKEIRDFSSSGEWDSVPFNTKLIYTFTEKKAWVDRSLLPFPREDLFVFCDAFSEPW
jgi:hypothetical protein